MISDFLFLERICLVVYVLKVGEVVAIEFSEYRILPEITHVLLYLDLFLFSLVLSNLNFKRLRYDDNVGKNRKENSYSLCFITI